MIPKRHSSFCTLRNKTNTVQLMLDQDFSDDLELQVNLEVFLFLAVQHYYYLLTSSFRCLTNTAQLWDTRC